MNDMNSASAPSGGSSAFPMSRQSTTAAPGQAGNGQQGRRITLGGMNRRSSLGMTEAALGDLFGRRASGFGDIDVLGRRGSLDSTSAVLDAAIMDLTRRRLSMAMGGMPGDSAFTPNAGMSDAFQNMSTSGPFGMDAMSLAAAGGMGGMNSSMFSTSAAPGANSSGMANTGYANREPSSGNDNNRQKQLQEQQRELERRQNMLEAQRQKLVAAMEERRRVMQKMQLKMGHVAPSGELGSMAVNRNSLLGNWGGGLGVGLGGGLGANPGGPSGNLLMSLGGRTGLAAAAAAGSGSNTANTPAASGNSQWIVCKYCNAKAFANREEAAQHEALCMAIDTGRRLSMGAGNNRRSSLDLLMSSLDRPEFAARFGPSQKQQEAMRRDSLSALVSLDRRFSLTGDTQNYARDHATPNTMSNGPFGMLERPLPLAMAADKDWLTPLHCFVRLHCVEVFTATENDVATPSKGKRKPIQVGQIGIRCPHCHHEESVKARERGSVYYPTSIASIYNATMNLLQRHLHNCNSVPPEIMRRYETLKADDARSGTSKKYWVESALSLGLVDTVNGIRFSASTPPPLPGSGMPSTSKGNDSVRGNSNELFSSTSNTMVDGSQRSSNAKDSSVGAKVNMETSAQSNNGRGDSHGDPSSNAANAEKVPESGQHASGAVQLVNPEDETYSTAFSFHLLSQMQPCSFTEADRLGKRKGLPPGFPGLACKHCFGGYGSGRFFPSSIKTLSDTSKTLNVLHNHMMRCRKCPPEVREKLAKLRKQHDEERAKMKFGSQKAFFARIWDRLHFRDPNVTEKRKFKSTEDISSAPAQSVAAHNFGHQGAFFESALQQCSNPFDAAMAIQQYGDLMNKRQKLG